MDSIKAFVKYLTLLLSTARVICCCQLLSGTCVRLNQKKGVSEIFPFHSNNCQKMQNMRTGTESINLCQQFFSIPRNWLPVRNKYHVIRYELLSLHFTCEKYIAKRNKRFWLDKYRWKGIKEGFNFFKLGAKLISLKS